MQRFCKKCNLPLHHDEQFCGYCGTAASELTNDQPDLDRTVMLFESEPAPQTVSAPPLAEPSKATPPLVPTEDVLPTLNSEPIPSPPPQPPKKKKRFVLLLIIFLLVGILLIGGAAAFLLFDPFSLFDDKDTKSQHTDDTETETTTTVSTTTPTTAQPPHPYADTFFPDIDKEYLTAEDLAPLSYEELTLALNELYARKGRIFEEENLRTYFEAKSWYVPRIPANEFDETLFNEYELANFKLIFQAILAANKT